MVASASRAFSMGCPLCLDCGGFAAWFHSSRHFTPRDPPSLDESKRGACHKLSQKAREVPVTEIGGTKICDDGVIDDNNDDEDEMENNNYIKGLAQHVGCFVILDRELKGPWA